MEKLDLAPSGFQRWFIVLSLPPCQTFEAAAAVANTIRNLKLTDFLAECMGIPTDGFKRLTPLEIPQKIATNTPALQDARQPELSRG